MGSLEKVVELKVYIFQLGESDGNVSPISQKAVRNAINAIDVLDENGILPTKIDSLDNGGICFVLSRSDGEDIFEFSKDGKMGYISQYYNREDSFNGKFEHFETLFDRFLIDRGNL